MRSASSLAIAGPPIAAVGLYVPGGTAAYPSSVLMNAVPAKVAGVPRLVMVVPAPDGKLNPLVLAAAKLAGVDEIYRVGGAQAVAALAYGTATIAPVDKIVGPGNAYVAAAKRLVFGKVGIDMIAGPSEVLIVAGPRRQSGVDRRRSPGAGRARHRRAIDPDHRRCGACRRGRAGRRRRSSRPCRARRSRGASWEEFGAVMLVRNLDEALAAGRSDRARASRDHGRGRRSATPTKVRNTGAIFLGAHTPEAIGDYVAGSNHVLPTARSARFSSGLGVLDFMKRTSILKCGAGAARRSSARPRSRSAKPKGSSAHARSVAMRLNRR